MGGGAAGVEGEDRKFPCERRGRILRFETQICRFVVAQLQKTTSEKLHRV